MVTTIDVKFISDSECLSGSLGAKGFFNSAKFLQTANITLQEELWRSRTASADNSLYDLHNSSDDTKAQFNNCFIIHSK